MPLSKNANSHLKIGEIFSPYIVYIHKPHIAPYSPLNMCTLPRTPRAYIKPLYKPHREPQSHIYIEPQHSRRKKQPTCPMSYPTPAPMPCHYLQRKNCLCMCRYFKTHRPTTAERCCVTLRRPAEEVTERPPPLNGRSCSFACA